MLGESMQGIKSKQKRELLLDKLDEETVLDLADTIQEGSDCL